MNWAIFLPPLFGAVFCRPLPAGGGALLASSLGTPRPWSSMALKRPREKKFDWPQPPEPYPPSQRSGAFIGPSGVGKTTTAIAMLMGPYKDVYSRVYVFSPSCAPGVDPAWDAWRKHVRIEMKVPDEENYVGSMGTRHFGKSSKGIKRSMHI